MKTETLSPELLHKMDAYWRAANYLSAAQIYLYDNPLLREPLKLSHVKPLVVGHWGTTPGQNFIYVHLNRVIKKNDLKMIYIAVPGMAAQHWWPILISKGPTARSIRISARMRAGSKKCLRSFHFQAEFPVMFHRRLQDRFMKAVSWVIHSAMRLGPSLTIQISSSRALSGMVRRKP